MIGGFLAGSGWMLTWGALRVMTGQTLNLQSLPFFFRPEILTPEGVGVGIIAAVVMFIHNYSRVEVVAHALSGSDQGPRGTAPNCSRLRQFDAFALQEPG